MQPLLQRSKGYADKGRAHEQRDQTSDHLRAGRGPRTPPDEGYNGRRDPNRAGDHRRRMAGIEGALEWFSDLPRVVILATLWVMGAALLGSRALLVYLAGRVLVVLAAGAA